MLFRSAAITGTLAENLFVRRTMRFQAEFEREIEQLTAEAVNAGLRRYINPKRLFVITAGDFKK